MNRRRDFFLDEPLNCQEALDDLRKFTERNKQYFGLPTELDIIWIKTHGFNISGDRTPLSLDKIRTAIENPMQVILLWASDQNIPVDEELVESLNQFSESIPNPIILATGMLKDWNQEWGLKLKFSVIPVSYFEYEAANAWADNISLPNIVRSKKFLFMGSKDYPSRKFILSHIMTHNLKADGYVSYTQFGGGQLAPAHYSTEEIAHVNQIADSANMYLPMEPIDDNPSEYTRMPRQFMTDSYLNMVTDTFFETSYSSVFVSEKVFNAMIHEQMFMMLSPANTLQFLRDSGYKTFGEFVDESYDQIQNNHDRIVAVTNSFMDFVSKPIQEIQEIYLKCLPILEHNRKLVMAKRLPEFLITEIQRVINEKAQIK